MGKPNRLTLQLIAISGILLSIFVSVLAYKQFQSPISQADLGEQAAGLIPPYLRLEQVESSVPNEVIVEVLVNTAGQQSNAADVEISFDPSLLQLGESAVENANALRVFQLNPSQSGTLSFSLFSNPERDEPVLQTNADEELVVARIRFQQVIQTASIARLEVGETTTVALYETPRPESATNILRQLSGVNLTLE